MNQTVEVVQASVDATSEVGEDERKLVVKLAKQVADARKADRVFRARVIRDRAVADGRALEGFEVSAQLVAAIIDTLIPFIYAKDPDVDVVLTTGGTGFSPRDVTPEAVKPLFRRELEGFSVVFHLASLGTVGVATLQSRALAGQAEDTFVFCVPGSTGACRDAWDLVLAEELDSRFRPCSLVGQIPRFRGICP